MCAILFLIVKVILFLIPLSEYQTDTASSCSVQNLKTGLSHRRENKALRELYKIMYTVYKKEWPVTTLPFNANCIILGLVFTLKFLTFLKMPLDISYHCL